MKLKNYIWELEAIMARYGGEIEVDQYEGSWDRINANPPEIAYRRVLSKRESKEGFWYHGDEESKRGEMVVKL